MRNDFLLRFDLYLHIELSPNDAFACFWIQVLDIFMSVAVNAAFTIDFVPYQTGWFELKIEGEKKRRIASFQMSWIMVYT